LVPRLVDLRLRPVDLRHSRADIRPDLRRYSPAALRYSPADLRLVLRRYNLADLRYSRADLRYSPADLRPVLRRYSLAAPRSADLRPDRAEDKSPVQKRIQSGKKDRLT
jgi:hypothetical protein